MKQNQSNKIKAVLTLGIAFLFFGLNSCFAQVKFAKTQDFEAMKKEAQASGKFIFIDAYTDWCGWCKVMDNKTFSQKKVEKLMHNRFVNYKLEMEKDSLGKILSMKYGVTGFPTYLIFTPTGQLHAQTFGFVEPEPWLAQLDSILKLKTIDRPGISSDILLDWPEFYLTAFGVGNPRKFPEAAVVKGFLRDSDLMQEVPFRVAKRFYYLLDENYQNKIIAQRIALGTQFGKDFMDDFLKNILESRVTKLVDDDNQVELMKAIEAFESYFPEAFTFRENVLTYYYKKHKKYDVLVEMINATIDDKSPAQLNDVAWDMYENCNDQTLLASAVEWMKDVVAVAPEYAYLDTYAALLYKTKEYKAAEEWAVKAIEVGKAANEKVLETENLLIAIKKERNK